MYHLDRIYRISIGAAILTSIGCNEARRGHILLQEHDDQVSYRNIKIRPL